MHFRSFEPFTVSALIAALGFLWLRLVQHLSFEWSNNPQYAYGWAVPVLCIYLFWRDLRRDQPPSIWPQTNRTARLIVLLIFAFGYALTRLIAEANPDWRLSSWALSCEIVAFTLLFLPGLLRCCGVERQLQSVVPIAFFLVAVPWPTMLEHRVVQALTGFITVSAVELLGALGQPALSHGNLIEIGAGTLGIDQGCSGIRSLQTSLMLGLFIGEVYRLGTARRWLLIGLAIFLALCLNVLRATFLAWVVTRKGLDCMTIWHDFAGVIIPLCTFVGILALAMFFRDSKSNPASCSVAKMFWIGWFEPTRSLATSVCVWIVVVELGTEAWFRQHERSLPPPTCWTVVLPHEEPDFSKVALVPSAHQILRFDESITGRWSTANGLKWQATFLRWAPGGIAARLGRNHTPQDCLSAIGAHFSDPESVSATAGGINLAFQCYSISEQQPPGYVFFCLWEDRGAQRTFGREWLTYRNRLEAVWTGRRNSGLRSLELVVWGAENEQSAREELRALVKQIVRIEV